MRLLKLPFTRLVPTGRGKVIVPIVAVLAIGGIVAGLLVSGGGGPTKSAAKEPSTTAVPTTTTSTLPYLGADHCPLTDLPAPGGAPLRPALGIKVGNEPNGARPQSGLNEADIVFDTPAEGFIMRYIAVFQCNEAALVGPNRSVRWVDQRLVRQFVQPILAFAGGINPNVDAIMTNGWIRPANLLQAAAGAGIRTTNRVPPDNLFSSTAKLWAMYSKDKTPPPPIFRYTPSLPAGATPASAVSINFSYDTDVVWKWDASIDGWLHTYSGAPDIDTLTGQPVSASNIIIEVVDYRFGKYIESTGGSGDFESETIGSGIGYVLRNGEAIKVTWSRKNYLSPTVYTTASGTVVGLTPGRTWVELLPNTTYNAKGSFSISP